MNTQVVFIFCINLLSVFVIFSEEIVSYPMNVFLHSGNNDALVSQHASHSTTHKYCITA